MRLMVGKSLIPMPRTVCPEDFGFKFKQINLKFKQLKELKAKTFVKDNNNIKALKRLITFLKGNYTEKIVNLVKDSKVCQLFKEQDLYKIHYKIRGLIYYYLQY